MDDEGNLIDPNEPRYCLCNRVSFGEMINCENVDVSWIYLLFYLPGRLLSSTSDDVSKRIISPLPNEGVLRLLIYRATSQTRKQKANKYMISSAKKNGSTSNASISPPSPHEPQNGIVPNAGSPWESVKRAR